MPGAAAGFARGAETARLYGAGDGVKALNFLAWLLLIPAVALTAFLGVTQSGRVYGWIQDHYVEAETVGVSDADRYRLNDALAEYIRGGKDELDDRATVFGVEQTAFNGRERSHMQDVQALFALARRCCIGLWALGIAALALLLKRRVRLLPGYRAALGVWLAALAAVVAWAVTDFTRAFEWFHRMLFSNELWLLDPATDLMIRMLPEAFFAEIAAWALAAMVGAVAAVGIVLAVSRRGGPLPGDGYGNGDNANEL